MSHPKWTPVFEWCIFGCGSKKRQKKKTYVLKGVWSLYSEFIIILDAIVNIIWGCLYEHLIRSENLHFDNKYDTHMSSEIMEKAAIGMVWICYSSRTDCEFHIWWLLGAEFFSRFKAHLPYTQVYPWFIPVSVVSTNISKFSFFHSWHPQTSTFVLSLQPFWHKSTLSIMGMLAISSS